MDEELFPNTVIEPIRQKMEVCKKHMNETNTDLYSDTFLRTFENSKTFSSCKTSLKGMIKWNSWGKCNKERISSLEKGNV